MNLRFFSLLLATIAGLALGRQAFAQAGNDNPGGVTAEYNGNITTAGNYDPYTGNARREIDDIVVPGAIGAYPLKYSRIMTTRSLPVGWTGNYAWGVTIYDPDTNNCTDFHTCGPVGRVNYPGGSSFDLEEPYTPGIWYLDANGRHGPTDVLVQCSVVANSGCEPQAAAEIRRADGGKVLFERLPSAGTQCRAYAIIDPYGQRTTLTYYDSVHYTIWKVTEPGGRYLEFIYSQGGPLTTVRANDGRGYIMESVNYGYDWFWSGQDGYYGLSHVYYEDGAVATYTYVTPNNFIPSGQTRAPNLIHSCDDPRYAGPMKYIEYEYVPSTEVPDVGRGQIKAEKNILGQRVSSTTYPPAFANPLNDPNWYRRTETRGDGPSRTIYYGGNALNWTDFKNQTFYDAATPSGWTVTDPRGNTTTYETQGEIGPVRKITYPQTDPSATPATREYTFTDPANPRFHSGEKDENGHWTYFDRDTTNANPAFRSRVRQIRYPDSSTEQFTYNNFGQVLDHKLKSDRWEHFRYDTRGRKIEYWPPATPSDPDPSQHKTFYFYYDWGPHADRLLRVQNPRGNSTWYEYNARGQVTKTMHQDATFTQSGYNAGGTLAWSMDELGHTTSYTYNQYKRLLTVTNPLGKTTTNYYGLDWANPLVHTTNSVKYTVSPMGKNVVYDYDANFRKIAQTVAAGTSDVATTWFEYDEVGNLIRTTDPLGHSTSFAYDRRNRQTTITDALGFVTTTNYDAVGNKNWVKHATGTPEETIVQYPEYDSMNRLKRQIDERGVTTTMGYDTAGNLAWSKDGNTNLYSYTYDALSRRTSMVYPDGSRELYSYDGAGNLASYTNRAGNVQTFINDNRNRQTGFDWNDNFTPSLRTTYDAASRVTQIWNWNATINYTYWDNNLLKTEQELTDYNYNHTTRYSYDADGNRQSLTCPSGNVFQYAYNNRNQLTAIGNENWVTLVSYQYDRAGNRQQRALYNGTVTEHAPVDARNRSAWVRHKFNGTEIGRFDYGFDGLSRLKYEQRNGGSADGYRYDPASEVTGFNRDGVLNNGTVTGGSLVAGLSYDSAGNRSQVTNNGTPTTWSVNNLNEYTNTGSGSVGSDLKGNVQSYNGWNYTYDAQNRLRVAQNGSARLEFWYDGKNRQIARTSPGPAPRPRIALVANANGLYVTAENAGNAPLIANRGGIGQWEQFEKIDLGNGYIALRSLANGLYVCAENGGASPLIANRSAVGTWEQFQLVAAGGGKYALVARANGLYVCAENAGASSLIANRGAIGGWEQFSIVSLPGGVPVTRSVWDGWDLLEERDVNDQPVQYYLHGARTDELVLRWGGVYGDTWYGYDGRGNVSHLFDYSGVVERYTYGLAGEPRILDPGGIERLDSIVANRFLFQGRDYLKEGAIYDYRNRFYHPGLGRFMQPDPIGFKGDPANLYRYCGNDPVDGSDPTGLIATDWTWSRLMWLEGSSSYGFNDLYQSYVNAGASGGGSATTVTGMPARQANPAPESDRPTSDTTKSMTMTIAMDPATGDQKSEDGGYFKNFFVQLTNPNGKPQDGRGWYAQEAIKVRVNQCSGDGCVKGQWVSKTSEGKPLYEIGRNGQIKDRVGPLARPGAGTTGTLIRDQRWYLQRGTEQKYFLPGVFRQTTVAKPDGTVTNTLAPTSEPW